MSLITALTGPAVVATRLAAPDANPAAGPPGGGGPLSAETAERLAREAGRRFLDRYMRPDGRVVRPTQSATTVSEGQAYALLIAVALGDENRFGRVLTWARDNLREGGPLMGWLWRDGAVVDRSPASDADVDAARALVLAADRFGVDDYRDAGVRVARSVVNRLTVPAGDNRVLVAGPWATTAPRFVNPSYLSPRALRVLETATGDPVWAELGRSSYRIVDQLTAVRPGLPPDWARLTDRQAVRPAPPPGRPHDRAVYSHDAARVLVRMGADCRPAGRRLAARAWPFLREAAAHGMVTTYTLDGQPARQDPHPVAWVAAAGAAHGAGREGAVASLLERAQTLQHRQPTYYGAAWVALGRILLTTSLLGECRS